MGNIFKCESCNYEIYVGILAGPGRYCIASIVRSRLQGPPALAAGGPWKLKGATILF